MNEHDGIIAFRELMSIKMVQAFYDLLLYRKKKEEEDNFERILVFY
jgi:hypothetical protein